MMKGLFRNLKSDEIDVIETNIDHFASVSLINYDTEKKKVQIATGGTIPILVYRATTQQFEKISDMSYPLVVKPADAYSSKGVRKAINKEELEEMLTPEEIEEARATVAPEFLEVLEKQENCIAIGCRDFDSTDVPRSSRFGRKFSNFWCRLETGITCQDTQSGFRAYPVKIFNRLKLFCSRYNFEIEILVRLLWAGCELREIPISVTYQDQPMDPAEFLSLGQ